MAFQNPIVAGEELIIPGIRSDNYVEGVTGWRIVRDGQSQFQSMQVLETLGADNVDTRAITLAGSDLGTILSESPQGTLAYGSKGSDVNTAAIGNTETVAYRSTMGPVYAGRLYKLDLSMLVSFVTNNGACSIVVRVRFTDNGTLPGTTNAVLGQWIFPISVNDQSLNAFRYFTMPDAANIRIAITLSVRTPSTSTVCVNQSFGSVTPTQYTLTDCGEVPTTGTLAQISKTSGSPDAEGNTRFTTDYLATWSQSYRGDSSPITDVGIWQGNNLKTGMTKSLVGFDFGLIQSDLVGASIVECRLIFKCQNATNVDGVTAIIGTHDFTSAQLTWTGIGVNANRFNVPGLTPGESANANIGVTVGNEFKSGTSKGIVFGPAPNTSNIYSGYFYEFPDAPILRLVYDK